MSTPTDQRYTVEWTTGYESGTLRDQFRTKAEARKAGNAWKKRMVDKECAVYDRWVMRKYCSFDVVVA